MGNATSEPGLPGSVAHVWPQGPAAEAVLAARPARPIPLVQQNLALQGLARALARSDDNVLQQLVESALALCGAQSAGVSLIEYDGTDKVFRWHAVAGRWSRYLMGSMPRDASPCGIVVDRHAAQIMPNPELYFPAMLLAEPLATEALLVPFNVMGETVGTVWVVSHDDMQFAADDLRVIACLSDFAAAAYLMHTTLRSIEEQARRTTAYLAQGERMAHAGSWSVNMRTKAVFWSAEHYRICGLEPGAPITLERGLAMIHPDDRTAALQTWEGAIAAAQPYELQTRIVRPDGAVRHIRSIGQPVFDDAGAVEEFVGSMIDETERRDAEVALARARQQLAHVARVATVGELATSIAHEVNQPLAAISANAQACMRWISADPPDVAEARAAAQRIVRDAERAGDVIRHIRAFLTRGNHVDGPIRMHELVREAAALLAGEARAHGVALEAHADPGMPDATGDRIQLQQVLVNLVMNAIDALAEVTDRPRQVNLHAAAHSTDELRVTVRDNGPGIPPQDIDRVFQGFYTTKTEGLGMGLAISRTIVEAHGGRIWATPRDGPGITFTLSLPVAGGGDA